MSFDDYMIDDGFDNPSDYMDYLEGEAEDLLDSRFRQPKRFRYIDPLMFSRLKDLTREKLVTPLINDYQHFNQPKQEAYDTKNPSIWIPVKNVLLSDYLKMYVTDSDKGNDSYWGKTHYFTPSGPFRLKIKEDEYYNTQGDFYDKRKVLLVEAECHYIHERNRDFLDIDDTGVHKSDVEKGSVILNFYPYYHAPDDVLTLFDEWYIKDAVIRFELDSSTGLYNLNGKYISFILLDGSKYEFKGDQMPPHRFGEKAEDYKRNVPNFGYETFLRMYECRNGWYKALYKKHSGYIYYKPD